MVTVLSKWSNLTKLQSSRERLTLYASRCDAGGRTQRLQYVILAKNTCPDSDKGKQFDKCEICDLNPGWTTGLESSKGGWGSEELGEIQETKHSNTMCEL